jgi:hypothetical protein
VEYDGRGNARSPKRKLLNDGKWLITKEI